MSTENGVPQPRKIAQWVDEIRRRRDYLVSRVEHGESNGYVEAELTALEWALPVLEAEHGAILRLSRELTSADGVAKHLAEADQLREFGRHEFESTLDDVDGDVPLVRRYCAICDVQFARHLGATRPEHQAARP